MGGLVRSVQFIWAISVVAQVAVCSILLLKGHFRKLPVFTAFIATNLCQAELLYVVYGRFGVNSHTATALAWSSQAATVILRTMAAMEILWIVLRPYRGIWGLGWRLLAVAFGSVLTYGGIEAGKNMAWAIVLCDRGFHLASAAALTACVLLIRYYAIPVQAVYKLILGGFCFYSCAIIVENAVLQALYVRNPGYQQAMWQATTMISFVIVQVVWAVALRKPLPAAEREQALLKSSVYRQISPEINVRLRLLNEQLMHFWEPEATRN